MVAALFVAALMNTSAGTNVPVAVFPSDGSQAASPTTQVSFRGAPIKDLTGIKVTGSKTGSHKGRLAAHSDGFGASFLPYKPFRPGETVTVSADPDLIGAGGDGDMEFKIAEQGRRSESGHSTHRKRRRATSRRCRPAQCCARWRSPCSAPPATCRADARRIRRR